MHRLVPWPPRGLPALALTVCALCATTASLAAQVLQGTVRETQNDQPVDRARVALRHGDSTVAGGYTDGEGAFRIAVPAAGDYAVVVTRIGFRPLAPVSLTFGPSDTATVAILLERIPAFLDPIVVEAEAYLRYLGESGFYRRERMGFGRHLGPEWVAERQPGAVKFADLATQAPGVTAISSSQPGVGRIIRIMGCGSTRFFVDDTRVIGFIDEWVDPSDVLAIEIYGSTVGAPVRYGTCSIVIWTVHSSNVR